MDRGIEEKFVQHRLKWFGHVQRRPPEAPVHCEVLSQANNMRRGRGRPKLIWGETIKRDLKAWDKPRDLCLNRSAFQALLSKQSIPIHVSFGLPLLLLTLISRLRTPQCTGASRGLLWTWPNHLSRCWTCFSLIGATSRRSRISSFRTQSILV